ncbi:helix-turn-helix domain-containing protein [soil metagenome]
MIYQIIQPAIHLQDFVKDYQLIHAVFNAKYDSPVKPFPSTTQHSLVFYLRGGITAVKPSTNTVEKFATIAINGAQLSNFNFHLSQEFLMLSVNFQPGALSKFLKLPLIEFLDARIDATAILNPEIQQVFEQMVNAEINDGLIKIVETYLWKRIQVLKNNFQPIDEVSRMMLNNPTACSIKTLASHACLSVSQFERRFIQQEGISPKLFNRINRFNNAFLLKSLTPHLDWLSIAVRTGYNDYQHLVKDFKQFSGTTPNNLLKAEAKAPTNALELFAKKR